MDFFKKLPANNAPGNTTSNIPKKYKILCLHGKRTSAAIMKMQTAAFRGHIRMEYVFIDAPFPASGPPDEGIALFYPKNPYYEWYHAGGDDIETKQRCLEYVLDVLVKQGPFDGLLGFSQGAAVATKVIHHLLDNNVKHSIQFVMLLGGVCPPELDNNCAIDIPSLHIMGLEDPYLALSKQLVSVYDKHLATIIEHKEGHQIPSLRTGIYQDVNNWLLKRNA